MAPRRKKIYEGKAKILYEGTEPGTLIQYFKDDATAFNAQKKATIEGKGVLNNRLSEFFMNGLTNIGVPNHFIRRINMREQLIRQVEIIPLEVIVRNFAAGSCPSAWGWKKAPSCPVRSSNIRSRMTNWATRWCPRNTSSPSAGPPSRIWTISCRWRCA